MIKICTQLTDLLTECKPNIYPSKAAVSMIIVTFLHYTYVNLVFPYLYHRLLRVYPDLPLPPYPGVLERRPLNGCSGSSSI